MLIAAVGWFLVISPQLSSASSLRSQATAVDQQNSLLQAKVNKLKKANAGLSDLTASLQRALDALPFDSGLPALTRQLSAQARQHRVNLTSIGVGSINPIVSTPTPVTTAGSTAVTSAESSGRLFSIPVTLVSTGSLRGQLAFLAAVQADGPRRALVTSTVLAPASGSATASLDASCTITTQLTVFTAALSPQARAQLEKLLHGDISD